jgi:hypothetical protein
MLLAYVLFVPDPPGRPGMGEWTITIDDAAFASTTIEDVVLVSHCVRDSAPG